MTIKASIGRFDGEYKNFVVNEGESISVLLGKANLTLGSGEAVNDDCANAVSPNDAVKDGETYHIVTNYKNGSF